LNRTVLGIGLTSFFSDLSHETATAILPVFLASISGSAAALGLIEGISDGIASLIKWPAGWFTDRTGIRKPIGVLGYALTTLATGSFALARSWLEVLLGRVVAWTGRGVRTPVRDVLLAASVTPESYGRAFGLERALDTLGAICGPLLALVFLRWFPVRQIFLLTLMPGLLAVASFGLLVKAARAPGNHGLTLGESFHQLPGSFKAYLVGVGCFGLGDFAHTLLIFRATQALAPLYGVTSAVRMAILLYAIHNVCYAAACYGSGHLGDWLGTRNVLAGGYALGVLMCAGFFFPPPQVSGWVVLFVLGGLYVGVEEALERAVAAELLPTALQGSGFGVLASVNGFGDVISSVLVGWLFTAVSPAGGFAYAGILMFSGFMVLIRAVE